MRILWLALFLSVGTGQADAQKNKLPYSQPGKPGTGSAHLYLIASAAKDKILLRWAPSAPGAWKLGNGYGYILERYTVSRNDVLLKQPERLASKKIIRPLSLRHWDSLAAKNDYAAVLAQAIYGDDFEVSVSENKDGASFINRSEQSSQRFAMALYAADHDFTAASYAGLAWTDKTVKPQEKYLYRLFSLIPRDKMKMDTALVFSGLDEYKPLPKPAAIYPEFGDRSVVLSWDFDGYSQYYTSYNIERSSDGGKTFEKASDLPVTKGTDSAFLKPALIIYADSLASNEITYQYRVQGISIFGETGPYSDPVKGKGHCILQATPSINGLEFNKNGKTIVNWEFDDSLNKIIKGFQVRQAAGIEGPYKEIGGLVDPLARKMTLDTLSASAYVTVAAIPLEGDPHVSYPYLVQPEDSLPPATPVGFFGRIDSAGIVTLEWQANNEQDLLGYKVFKSTATGHEYRNLTDTVWKQPSFRDTLNLKDLNSTVYYTVRAIDTRFNQSALATVIALKKPDVIPPTQPVFASYEVRSGEVMVRWVNSSDKDVQKHVLYRKEASDTAQWLPVAERVGSMAPEFSDKLLNGGHSYTYTLIAFDSSGLQSIPSPPLTVVAPESRIRVAVKKFDAVVDRDNRLVVLTWQQAAPAIVQYELYRGADKKPLSLYKVLPGDLTDFTDKELTVNTNYQYALRAVYADGKNSDMVIKKINY